MKLFTKITTPTFLLLTICVATVQSQEYQKQFAVGAHIGSLGAGLHGHFQPSYLFSGTAYVETLNVSVEQRKQIENDPGSVLKADSNILLASTNLNLHPFRNGFRISGGLTFGNPELTGKSTYNSNDVSNNDGIISYTIGAKNAVQPYLGIGYSAYRGGKNRLYFHGDLGVAHFGGYEGSAVVDLNCSNKPTLLAQSACQTEQSIVQNQASNDARKIVDGWPEYYPVVRVGLGLKF